MRKINSALAVVLLLILFACGGKQSEDQIVSVTIEPQRYVAEKIAGDRFVIHTAVPIGQSPETYDPTPQQMLRLGKSVAYFRIGAIGFEQAWMPGIVANNPEMKVFDLSEGFELIHETEEHHDHQGHHHHGGSDPHIWSSVGGMRTIAWNTLNAFLALDKEYTAYYWQNYNQLLSEIDETEAIIKERLSPLAGDAFIIYHPALTYFAEEFGLLQFCIEMDGKEPSPARLKELISTAREHHAKVVFIQQEFDSKNAELIAKETDCRLVVINPLSYEWNKEMIHIAKALAGE
ncbi:zinc transport system substrate-binding protein [Parabacteroides sp. PF5-5]|uniref:metal ABC transporter solute-binding protein, Zn/Mn family n=1 Tax=unclassified Parabacteroides TaxID=2649774 RepID=UPI002476C847|nr:MULTISPECIES: zinc ABC transporter substrate-binding protein [unclassified Parabacteroides]MDH6304894.1 zinc transport system substrate-binding protein [Parabacteroides sp. PH5-39]MDH6316020.1 zinc transport system substrate-binding protein [Parabacteroides sp. PF5-13]MDH6319677.1 zinc transport system substrate-binding protein [Parabacteroides sp. PH5-13]MDH6323408.1 zinc transport system substrate-binding protein [Parabacteroides sp. PH5-8]MDH6327083.1 zinc transport system substrate-bind